ncbi:rhodanese-like domain-containing protein [soil metagenome]
MSGFAEISVSDAIARVDAGAYLVDVREQDEWDRGHAPAAHSIPMSRLNESIDQIPTGQEVLVVCLSGGRSARVSSALADTGRTPINVAGGMLAWALAGGDLEATAGDEPTIG